jgi:hypothetical protein
MVPAWARDHDSVTKAVTESVLSLNSYVTAVAEVQVYIYVYACNHLSTYIYIYSCISIYVRHRISAIT